jgi:hypothetical protein
MDILSPEELRRADPLVHFEWAVRALAQDATIQIALFPSFVVVADELALDFEQYRLATADRLSELGGHVVARVGELDAALEAMSGPEHLDLWTDEALRSAREWVTVRALARRVLEAAVWRNTPPPIGRAAYIAPDA